MADTPPPTTPPPTTPPPPGGSSPARPGVVTAAAILLIIGGAFAIIGAFFLISFGGIFTLLGVLFLAVGAVQIYAGIQCLNLREIGRKIGLVVAAIGALLALLSIARSPGTKIVNLAINAFVIWALWTNEEYFRA